MNRKNTIEHFIVLIVSDKCGCIERRKHYNNWRKRKWG